MKLQKDELIFKLGLLLVLIGCLNGVIGIIDWLTLGGGVKYIVMMIVSIITLIVGNPMLIIGLVMPPQKNK
jgi:hypothetical protein